jgi:hypothetical protein
MRHRAPHDHPPRRRPQPTKARPSLSGIRSQGVRHLLIYCSEGLYCHHSAVINADRWPDETVLLDLDRRAVCTRCGMIGADVRPNWCERPPPESLTGAQWR